MTRFTDAAMNALAQSASPGLDDEPERRAPPANWRELLGEPEPEWDRGEATQPVELYDEAVWQEFDAARNVDKNQKWHRSNDSAAMELDRLDAMRRDGAL